LIRVKERLRMGVRLGDRGKANGRLVKRNERGD